MSSPRTASLTLAGGYAEPPRPACGARIGGRYEVREELGRGGYGVVFNAWDHELRRPVALKIRRADRSDGIDPPCPVVGGNDDGAGSTIKGRPVDVL